METQRLPVRFRVWVGAATASQVGDAVLYFALGWAASDHGGTAAGLVLAAVIGPRTLLMLFGGAVADRVGSRAVSLVTDALLLAGSVVAAIVVASVGTPLWLLVVVALVLGTVSSFAFPATGAFPARLVEPAVLPRALALRNAGFQLASLAGGPLGGLLVAAAGFTAALGVNAVSFLAVLVVVLVLRLPVPEAPVVRSSLVREAGDALRVAAGAPVLRLVLGLYAVAGGFVLPISSLLVPLLARERGWDAGGAGLVVGAVGAGALVGALVFARTGTHPAVGRASGAGLCCTAVGAAALAFAPTAGTGVAAGFLIGCGLAAFIAHAGPLVVAWSPPTHLSRLQAVLGVVQSAALIGTNLLLGTLTAAWGGVPAVLVAAVVLAAAGGTAALHPALRARHPPEGEAGLSPRPPGPPARRRRR